MDLDHPRIVTAKCMELLLSRVPEFLGEEALESIGQYQSTGMVLLRQEKHHDRVR